MKKNPISGIVVCLLFSFQICSTPCEFKLYHLAPKHQAKAEQPSFLQNVQTHFLTAAEELNIPSHFIQQLLEPEKTIEVEFTIKMDDGTEKSFKGWRVQHSFLRGPAKGGIRIAPDVHKEEVQALATSMTIKDAIFNLPLGGGKGGIAADARSFSDDELARLMRAYVKAVMDTVWEENQEIAFGVSVDSPAPDMGTNSRLMNVCADAYLEWVIYNKNEYNSWLSKHNGNAHKFAIPKALLRYKNGHLKNGFNAPYLDYYLNLHNEELIRDVNLIGSFTGKEVGKGGSLGRTEATGSGIVYTTFEIFSHLGALPKEAKGFSGQTVAIQGLGNVGSFAAKKFIQMGAKVVAFLDIDESYQPCAIYKESGFSIEELELLFEYKKKFLTLENFPGTKNISKDDFWTLHVDILSPCAKEDEITAEVAKKIQAKSVVEGANGPTTSEGEKILLKKGITIIPDVLANGGGVTVSYFEMHQNETGQFWDELIVDQRLWKLIKTNIVSLLQVMETHKKQYQQEISIREAVYLMAVERIWEAYKQKYFPEDQPLRFSKNIFGSYI